jgi:shikimate dehydrogenase
MEDMMAAFPNPIGAATTLCAVFGHPVRHSGSPAMQNAAMAALGLDWRYVAFDVRPEDLAEALRGVKVMGFAGVNLTVPHKILAVDLVDELDESAKRWGAVNTVRVEGLDFQGKWKLLWEFTDQPVQVRLHGFNTDADAISRSIVEDLGMELRGKRVLLLGAGGAGRTTALKLASDGVAELFLVNRTRSKSESIAAEIRENHPQVTVSLGYPPGEADLIVNATSLGLKPKDALPLDEALFPLKRSTAVYDMIYSPVKTELLARAAAAGCRTANGIGMLVYQGARALELWTNRAAPVEVMRRALEEHLYGAKG